MALKDKANEIYEKFKCGRKTKYEEEKHCKLLIEVMLDKDRGTMSAFCIEAVISDYTFWAWVQKYDTFGEIHSYCKMVAREIWEKEGRELRDAHYPMGTINHAFEHWKLIGWSRFGISKNSRIKLNLDPDATPDKHYAALLKQANGGDFTASEIKQLMEAINVGLRTHETIKLQKDIDQLRSDLGIMQANSNANNSGANKGPTQENFGTLADSICKPDGNAV